MQQMNRILPLSSNLILLSTIYRNLHSPWILTLTLSNSNSLLSYQESICQRQVFLSTFFLLPPKKMKKKNKPEKCKAIWTRCLKKTLWKRWWERTRNFLWNSLSSFLAWISQDNLISSTIAINSSLQWTLQLSHLEQYERRRRARRSRFKTFRGMNWWSKLWKSGKNKRIKNLRCLLKSWNRWCIRILWKSLSS